MPIYEYRLLTGAECAKCANGFEAMQKIADAPLTCCPQCGAPVERIISAPAISSSGPSLSSGNLEKHGFTQYRKAGPGEYQKTAGKGPNKLKR